ncbi:DNA polymerase-3 subunit beta [Chitinivorax tropicus]|uniref:Beta sliding clamp n=1 Tax=Chitinivorax tropicus TaxID=714531 RepID=A0A840MNM9_9PROT|nr:DNA polymerase III subunit beta [Chitinivorax tropicus]MBB5020248.1 DNA polymerase-3 subunit beta [Chitinivorax tropicus]
MVLMQAERDLILKPLTTVTGIVERRHTLPILSNVLIEKKGTQLTFLATDLEIQITSQAPGELVGDDFAITVSAKKLQDILRAIPDQTQVSLDHTDSKLTVKAGKSRFNLQTLPANDFPKLAPAAGESVAFELPQKTLKHLLSMVQYSMAHQDIRYYLNGLCVVTDGRELKLVSTDGHRLALVSHQLEADVAKTDLILPRKTVLELYKQLSDTDTPIRIEIGQNQVRFAFGDVVLVSKVVDGKFPDYNRVIPARNDKHLNIDRLQLQQALQRASILSNEKFRGVRVVLMNGLLRILCNNSEQEEAQEELEVDYQGDSLDIGFNITYLLDVLANINEEILHFSFGDAMGSVLVTVPDNEHFKYVVMPMRI